jgi:SnoaL-like domain
MGDGSIEDRVLIREVYDAFYFAANDGDTDRVEACFAPGGHITRYDGAPATPEFSAAKHVWWNNDPVGQTYQHHVTNLLVSPDPEGRDDFRAVRSYLLVSGPHWDNEPTHIDWDFDRNVAVGG